MNAVLYKSAGSEVVSAYDKRAPRMAAKRQDPVCSGDFGLRPRNWVADEIDLRAAASSSAGASHAETKTTGAAVWHDPWRRQVSGYARFRHFVNVGRTCAA